MCRTPSTEYRGGLDDSIRKRVKSISSEQHKTEKSNAILYELDTHGRSFRELGLEKAKTAEPPDKRRSVERAFEGLEERTGAGGRFQFGRGKSGEEADQKDDELKMKNRSTRHRQKGGLTFLS